MSLSNRPRVLVVDDNAAFLDNLQELLGDAGYQVYGASSCREARERAREGFDVALVDLRLPDGEGTALARELKEKVPESEVVLLTGFATLETAVAAVRAGACAYLMKPCAPNELLLTLEQAMRQVRLQEEKRELARRAQVTEKLAAVGTMTAGLSHEIRNPLNAAALQLSVLERYCGGMLASMVGDSNGWRMPICSACQRLPASTVRSRSATPCSPSALMRCISGASLSVMNLIFTPVLAV